ncbi:MAG TPA: anaerobic ribonucleoside-triphosphate reductase [Lamprocystis sp. (in: g-proteobacteria)]|nr:anaerobic ribonucleoside-triphosphate reductase [Lamprocystis sp. (in: g-proteobacteria)]
MNALNTDSLNPEERTRCEVWTRVMGYHRPVAAFNVGKRAEHADRCYFTESPQGTLLRAKPRAAA